MLEKSKLTIYGVGAGVGAGMGVMKDEEVMG